MAGSMGWSVVRSRRPRVVGSLQATLQGARPLPRPRLGHARAPTVTLPVRGSPGQSGQQAALGHTACAETRAAEGWGRKGRRAGPWELSPTGRRAGSVGRAGQGRLGELMRGTPLPLDAAGAQTGRSQLVLGGATARSSPGQGGVYCQDLEEAPGDALGGAWGHRRRQGQRHTRGGGCGRGTGPG